MQDLLAWERRSLGAFVRVRRSSSGVRVETSFLTARDAEKIPKFVRRPKDGGCEWTGPASEVGERLREVAGLLARMMGGR